MEECLNSKHRFNRTERGKMASQQVRISQLWGCDFACQRNKRDMNNTIMSIGQNVLPGPTILVV
jgi:hypothetical protein